MDQVFITIKDFVDHEISFTEDYEKVHYPKGLVVIGAYYYNSVVFSSNNNKSVVKPKSYFLNANFLSGFCASIIDYPEVLNKFWTEYIDYDYY